MPRERERGGEAIKNKQEKDIEKVLVTQNNQSPTCLHNTSLRLFAKLSQPLEYLVVTGFPDPNDHLLLKQRVR